MWLCNTNRFESKSDTASRKVWQLSKNSNFETPDLAVIPASFRSGLSQSEASFWAMFFYRLHENSCKYGSAELIKLPSTRLGRASQMHTQCQWHCCTPPCIYARVRWIISNNNGPEWVRATSSCNIHMSICWFGSIWSIRRQLCIDPTLYIVLTGPTFCPVTSMSRTNLQRRCVLPYMKLHEAAWSVTMAHFPRGNLAQKST